MKAELTAKTIDAFIKANWGSPIIYTPENVPFNEPDKAAWTRYQIRWAGEDGKEIASRLRNEIGILWWQIFSAENEGVRDAQKIADHIGLKFDNLQLAIAGGGQIDFRESEFRYVGKEATGKIMHACTIPFRVQAERA
jgi:hypothetical protein